MITWKSPKRRVTTGTGTNPGHDSHHRTRWEAVVIDYGTIQWVILCRQPFGRNSTNLKEVKWRFIKKANISPGFYNSLSWTGVGQAPQKSFEMYITNPSPKQVNKRVDARNL